MLSVDGSRCEDAAAQARGENDYIVVVFQEIVLAVSCSAHRSRARRWKAIEIAAEIVRMSRCVIEPNRLHNTFETLDCAAL